MKQNQFFTDAWRNLSQAGLSDRRSAEGQSRERECQEAESKVEVPLRIFYRVSRYPGAPCEANLSSLKEIEKPAGIKNPARLKAFRAAILPAGSVMPSRYGIACCAASSISAATSLGCDS
jgi:hypothetical protein